MDNQTPQGQLGDEQALHHIVDRMIAGRVAHIAGTAPSAVARVIEDLRAIALLHGATLSVRQGGDVTTVRVDCIDLELIPDEIRQAA